MNKEEKEKLERKYFKDVGLIPGLIKYYWMRIIAALIIILTAYIIASNISWVDGKLQWTPSIKTNLNIEVKK